MKRTNDQDLMSLEKRFWDAVQNRDSATASELSDDSCIVVGAQGVGAVERGQLARMLDQATYELSHYEFDESSIRIRKLTDDVAIVAYRVREDLVVDNKPESLEAFDASVWVRRGDTWLCALHTESLKGDPFGRHDIDRITHEPI